MKIPLKSDKPFESCPEYEGRAVCVDVTPLETRSTQYGNKQQFKIVFEVEIKKEDGNPYCVWSMWMSPSWHEKAAFAKFIKDWFGRVLTDEEKAAFDSEDLIGRPANIIVINEREDDNTYANIKLIRPDKSGNPLKATGTFKRKKDRDNNGNGSEYKKTEQAKGETVTDWAAVKVHVGKYAGHELRELTVEAVNALIGNWVPAAMKKEKLLADDKRLIQALELFTEAQQKKANEAAVKENEEIPY
jgi:hypothetical protein